MRLVAQSGDVRLLGLPTQLEWSSSPPVEPYYSFNGPMELAIDLAPLRGKRAVFALDEIAFGQCEMGGSSPGHTFIESIEVLAE